jgi:hypothetical protein
MFTNLGSAKDLEAGCEEYNVSEEKIENGAKWKAKQPEEM